MENQKLIQSPCLFKPFLNQNEIDLSIKKINLIDRETELILAIQQLNYELFEIRNSISSLDSHNNFAMMCHELKIRRQ